MQSPLTLKGSTLEKLNASVSIESSLLIDAVAFNTFYTPAPFGTPAKKR